MAGPSLAKHRLFWPASSAITLGAAFLIWHWWPGQQPTSAARKLADAWAAGDYAAIASSVHPDELQLMGASVQQAQSLLKDVGLGQPIDIGSMRDSSWSRGMKVVSLKAQNGKLITLDLAPHGRRWKVSLGSLLISSCLAAKSTSECTLHLADSMEKRGVVSLVEASMRAHTDSTLLRRHSSDPRGALRPLNMPLTRSEPTSPPVPLKGKGG